MEYGLALIVLAALVAVVVVRPLAHRETDAGGQSAAREELEAAKEAKYREIRDAELDHNMGKLSDDDWRSVDRELRAEAIEILRRLDSLTYPGRSGILSGVQVILAVIVIVLVLMHSGKDAGLSGAFGVGTGAGPFGGGSLVERNLNRWTIFFSLLFVVNVIILLKIG